MITSPVKVVPVVKRSEADRVKVAGTALLTPGCTTVFGSRFHVSVRYLSASEGLQVLLLKLSVMSVVPLFTM